MAKHTDGNYISREAGEALTSAQYHIVKLSSGKVVKAAAGTDVSIGVVTNAPASGDTASVFVRSANGTGKVLAGGSITEGAKITADSSGHAVVTTTDKDEVLGIALEAADSGDIFEFMPSNSTLSHA